MKNTGGGAVDAWVVHAGLLGEGGKGRFAAVLTRVQQLNMPCTVHSCMLAVLQWL